MANGIFHTTAASRLALDERVARMLDAMLVPGCSVLDYGAGPGYYVEYLNQRGHSAYGVDGTADAYLGYMPIVSKLDLTKKDVWKGFWNKAGWHEPPDVAMCIEVGEHIPEEYIATFIDNIASAAKKQLIISWAGIGQRGRDHISCHMPEWVVLEFVKRGWLFDEKASHKARVNSGRSFNRRLLVFKK